jgi:hypothetical protein
VLEIGSPHFLGSPVVSVSKIKYISLDPALNNIKEVEIGKIRLCFYLVLSTLKLTKIEKVESQIYEFLCEDLG